MAQPSVTEALRGGAASAVACLFSNPIDVARTRQQLRGRGAALGRGIASGSSWRGCTAALQLGLAPAMAYNVTLNATRFSLFHSLKGEGLTPLASGLAAGAVGGFVSAPLARAKTLMQASAASGYGATLRDLASRPFAGASAFALRNSGHTACTFTLFEWSQRMLERCVPQEADASPTLKHVAASLCAATASCLLMNPLDVVCTRSFASSSSSPPPAPFSAAAAASSAVVSRAEPTSPLECARRLVAREGAAVLYSGLGANMLRTVPHTALTFTFIEGLRRLAALPTWRAEAASG